MKKIISLVAVMLIAIVMTGCGNKNLGLEKIEKNIDELTFDKIDVPTANSNISSEFAYYEEMEDMYNLEDLGLNGEDLENYIIKKNDKNEFVIVLRPNKNKLNDVKKSIEKYIKDLKLEKDAMTKEKDGVLIYLNTANNKEILDIIYDSKSSIFSSLVLANDEMLKTSFSIDKDMVEEYLVKTPMMIVSSNMYAIIKPSKGNENKVKDAMDNYFSKLEEQWKTYLPDQYELVKNRKETKVGKYLIYIVSRDNDKVLNEIKENTK